MNDVHIIKEHQWTIGVVLSCEKMFEKLRKQKEGNSVIGYERQRFFKSIFPLNNILLKNAASTHVAHKPT